VEKGGAQHSQTLKMPKHHTAFYKKTRRAEESGGESLGLAPFYSFIQDFNRFFQARTRPSFHERAQQYLSGLFQLDHRRNVEKIDETVNGSQYQSLHHFLTHSPWDDEAVCAQISRMANDFVGGTDDSCLLIDPSGIPKKGRHSVGVARQYCGNLGKVDNCQVGVFAALGRGRDACLINKKLYLPKSWCEDPERCDKAGVPKEQRHYRNRAQLALELIEEADQQKLQYAWIGMDAEFGVPWFLSELQQRGKRFLIDVASNAYVYKTHPRMSYRPNGLSTKALRFKRKPIKVEEFRHAHGKRRWRRVEIRDSTKGIMVAEYLHKRIWFWDGQKESPPVRYHLLIRRNPQQDGRGWKYKYSLSNAPARTTTKRLAYQQSQRFWIEQAIRDAKDGMGIDEYQARKWRSWHHHVALTLMAGLFVLKTRLNNREHFPLLSITDVRAVLECLLPKKAQEYKEVLALIRERHERRRRAELSAKMCRDPIWFGHDSRRGS
jgi:SRSO17 transposase